MVHSTRHIARASFVRFRFSIAFAVLFVAGVVVAPQPDSAATPQAAAGVYYLGPLVTAPQPAIFAPVSSFGGCGTATLSAVVDANGKAGDILVQSADNAGLAKLAKKILAQTRFDPGTYDGVPVAVAIMAIFDDQICLHTNESLVVDVSVRAQPQSSVSTAPSGSPATEHLYKVGGPISAPIVQNMVIAKFSSYARRRKISGRCLIGLTVDANGLPQNPHVVKSLETSLDQNAMEAVEQYRFRPALKDGTEPVAVEIMVEVNFRLN